MESLLLVAAESSAMAEKIRFIVPEITLFVTTVIVMVLGGSPSRSRRTLCGAAAFAGLVAAGVVAVWFSPRMPASPAPGLLPFAKGLIAAVGGLLVLLMTGTVDREFEAEIDRGRRFDSIRSNRGEFYAFLLFSLTGLMLCASADDLIWLFLALELTSLPTYVMVSISTPSARSQEAGIKYFFLGAFAAAIFLFGFALLYGATGTTVLFAPEGMPSITASLAAQAMGEGLGPIAMLGLILSVVGVSFKIAAVPMHFYTPDVYQGASTTVAAFLAFVPKFAGVIALILILSAVGWHFGEAGTSLPGPVRITLWVMAALTMIVGNTMAILQQSVKRMLAYSSVAHSGYMVVGLIAGPGTVGGPVAHNGLAAVLFYMLCYGFMNLGAFAVLASVEKKSRAGAGGGREDIETVDDLRGLCATHPILGWTMVLSAGSLLGLPPLLGFFGKFFLFTSAIAAGEIALVVIMGLASAIAAFYYLRLVAAPLLEDGDEKHRSFAMTTMGARIFAAVASAASVVALVPAVSNLMRMSDAAIRGFAEPEAAEREEADQPRGDATVWDAPAAAAENAS